MQGGGPPKIKSSIIRIIPVIMIILAIITIVVIAIIEVTVTIVVVLLTGSNSTNHSDNSINHSRKHTTGNESLMVITLVILMFEIIIHNKNDICDNCRNMIKNKNRS